MNATKSQRFSSFHFWQNVSNRNLKTLVVCSLCRVQASLLSIIITSFKEPNVDFAIKAIVGQEIPDDYELIVAAPDAETKAVVEKFAEKYPQIRYFQDHGKGKSSALNLLFNKAIGKILIFTDGDVVVGKDSIKNLLKHFSDEKVGVVSGRPVSSNRKDNMMGY